MNLRTFASLSGVALLVLFAACKEPNTAVTPTRVVPSSGKPSSGKPSSGNPTPPAIASGITPGKSGGQFVIPTVGGPITFNPTVATDANSIEIQRLLFAKLANYDWQNQKSVPGLAHRWSVAEDQRTWTFELRKNLRWSDGAPLTTDDVLFTWNEVIYNPEIHTVKADIYTLDGRPFEVTKVDETTFKVVTPTVFAPFIEFFGDVEILPKHVLERAVTEKRFEQAYRLDTPPGDLVGSGPYRLKEFKPTEYTLLEKNPYYHRFDGAGTRLPYLDNVIFGQTLDKAAMAKKFFSGDAHVLEDVLPEDYESIRAGADAGKFEIFDLGAGAEQRFLWFNMNTNKVAKLEVTSQPSQMEVMWNRVPLGRTPRGAVLPVGELRLTAALGGKVQSMSVRLDEKTLMPLKVKFDFGIIQIAVPTGAERVNSKPVTNPERLKWFLKRKFRQAISHAIDRPGIVEAVFGGRAEFHYGFVSPANQAWYNPDVRKYPFDLGKAKALLAEIGIRDRDRDGLMEDEQGVEIEFSLCTNSDNAVRDQTARFVRDSLKGIGIRVVYEPLRFTTLVDKVTVNYDYECVLLGLAAASLDPQSSRDALLSSGANHFWNPGQLKPMLPWEARIDELFSQQVKTLDRVKRKELIDEVQLILAEESPLIQMVQKRNYAAIRNGIGNAKPTAMSRNRVTWNLDELFVK
jgi:ABC-type transport system substrate-binding protein